MSRIVPNSSDDVQDSFVDVTLHATYANLQKRVPAKAGSSWLTCLANLNTDLKSTPYATANSARKFFQTTIINLVTCHRELLRAIDSGKIGDSTNLTYVLSLTMNSKDTFDRFGRYMSMFNSRVTATTVSPSP